MPRGIGWWWGAALDWPEQQFDAFVNQQNRETLVQMLQETDPNGCWTDDLCLIEEIPITTVEIAREQMKTFWKEGQPMTSTVFKVKDVTVQLMKDFFEAYWKNCGSHEDDFMVEGYVQQAIENFRYCLGKKEHYNDGMRWDLMTYKYFQQGRIPVGVWPHVKVRFKVTDPMDGTPFEEQPFTFVVYGNSIASKDMHEKVWPSVQALVAKLAELFPVVAEA